MRVGVDASMLEPVRTGVGNYVFNLLVQYRRARPDVELVLFSDRKIGDDAKSLGDYVECIGPPIKKGPLWLSTGLRPALARRPVQVFWGGNGFVPIAAGRKIARVATIHDFVYALAPRTIGAVSRWTRRVFQPLAAVEADAIVCVSRSTAADLARFYGRTADAVVAPQIDERYTPASAAAVAQVRAAYDLPPRYLLSVGTLEPRKNLVTLLRAFLRLVDGGVALPPLVLAGKIGWLAADARAHVERGVARGAVRFLDYVPLEAMPALYSGADVFVFVPLYEGYGMPAREALRCGTPVIASDIPALREATDDTALFVGADEASIEAALRDFATGIRRPPRPDVAQFAQCDDGVERFAAVVDAAAAGVR